MLNKNNDGGRIYHGGEVGDPLAEWLNRAKASSSQTKKVVGLLHAMQRTEIGQPSAEAQRLLSDVRLRPAIQISEDGERLVYWHTLTKSAESRLLLDSSWYPFGVGDAIAAILQLWRLTIINRVLRCPCGNWFFGKFEWSRYCDPACQVHFGRETEEFKRKQRDYMREYQRRRRAQEKQKG